MGGLKILEGYSGECEDIKTVNSFNSLKGGAIIRLVETTYCNTP